MKWVDDVINFFQSMYDSVIDTVTGWYVSVGHFFTVAYDYILVIAIILLAIVIFKLLKYLTVPAIILSEITMLTVIITMMLSFVLLVATSLVSIYNKIFALTDLLSTGIGSIECFGYMINCLGADGVLSYFFTELFALFIVVLLIRVSGLFFWALSVISDKIWRIGVLMGLV